MSTTRQVSRNGETSAITGSGNSAAVYVRISSDPKGQRAGVERQRTDCERLAADLGVTDIRLYEDNDVSAFSGATRPSFRRMLADIADGQISTVIVWAVDRLYRRLTDLETIVSTLDAAGVAVHAVKSGDLDLSTADGRLHARLLGSVAQHESEKKSERITARAKQRATKELRMVASRRPFGWRFIDGHGGGLELDPVEAPALARAYRDIADGLTLQATHKRLAATTDIGIMTVATLGTILRNPRHGGLVGYKGDVVGEAADGQRVVDRQLWEQAHAILTDPARRTSTGRPANTWLGGGLLRCGRCGGRMAASRRNGVAVYTCSRHKHLNRRRPRLDTPVLAAAADVLARLGAAGLLAQSPADDTRAHDLRVSIADAESRLDALSAMVANGDLNPLDFGKAAAKIRAVMEADTAALAARAQRPALAALAAADDVRTAWNAAIDANNTATVRAILGDVMESVTADPEHSITIVWAGWTGLDTTVIPASPELTIQGRGQRRERAAALFTGGASISEIARQLHSDRATIRSDLKAMGVYP